MTREKFDEFLNDATLKVREIWEEATGQKMGDNETYALNDTLTGFFSDKSGLDRSKEYYCQRCGTSLDSEQKYCLDETCPFVECLQSDIDGWIGHPDPPEWVKQARAKRLDK